MSNSLWVGLPSKKHYCRKFSKFITKITSNIPYNILRRECLKLY